MKGTALAVAAVTAAVTATIASAMSFGGWTVAQSIEAAGAGADDSVNTAALEGCPSIARDGLTLYFASNRAGGSGGLDIYTSTRESVDDPWGAPTNLGPTINTAADEFCPTPRRDGHGLLFVSTKAGGCGGSDIYATRMHVTRGWSQPDNLGCSVNSAADEASPFVVGDELYFSSTRAGGYAPDPAGAVAGDSDIYVAPIADDGSIGTPTLAPGLNTAQSDARPNVRRDGMEIFFDSTRPGGLGSADVWTSTRATTSDAWSTPTNLGGNVNSTAAEARVSLSWDGTHLYFGSTRSGGEGSSDLYVSTRDKVPASS
jgi:Tol biopolymer transport system component